MKKIKQSAGDYIFDVFNYVFLTIAVLIVIYPLYFIVIASFSDPNAIYQGRAWLLPQDITFEGYRKILADVSIWTGYRNSLLYAVIGTAINIAVTMPAAYSLSRKDLDGRKSITLLITFTMIFSGGLIPTFLLVRNLRMVNTIWALIIPNMIVVWNLIVARTFFQNTIPDELHDAAIIDGASDFQFFFKVVLPLSQALTAIMILYYAVGHWNGFFNALIYLRNPQLFPLQLVLRDILIKNETGNEILGDVASIAAQQRIADLLKYGVIIAASFPLLVLYPFLQNYFIKGVMIGSIKG